MLYSRVYVHLKEVEVMSKLSIPETAEKEKQLRMSGLLHLNTNILGGQSNLNASTHLKFRILI